MLFNLLNNLFINHFWKFHYLIAVNNVVVCGDSDFERVAKCHTCKSKTNKTWSNYIGGALNSSDFSTILTTIKEWLGRAGNVWEWHRILDRLRHNELFCNKPWQECVSKPCNPENSINITNTGKAVFNMFCSFFYHRICIFHWFLHWHNQSSDRKLILHFDWLSSWIKLKSNVCWHNDLKVLVCIIILFEEIIHCGWKRCCDNIVNGHTYCLWKCLQQSKVNNLSSVNVDLSWKSFL